MTILTGPRLTATFSKICEGLDQLSNKPLLVLLLLLSIDTLICPYAGLVHDGRLYAAQSLAHLQTANFAKDLFFLFGSQDTFSVFSLIQARCIHWLGLHAGTQLLYLVSRILLFWGILLFSRVLLGERRWALLAAVIMAAGPLRYIFFDINEVFLTPRTSAVGLSLLGLAYCFQGRGPLSFLCFILAALLHPLMAMAPAAAAFFFLLFQGRKKAVAKLLVLPLAALGLLFFGQKEAGFSSFSHFDSQWKAILFSRSSYLFPESWSREQWMFIGLGIAVLFGVARQQEKGHRRMLDAICLTVVVFLAVALYAPDSQWVLPMQLQPWRGLWLLRIAILPAVFLWSAALWSSERPLQRLAVVFFFLPTILTAGAGDMAFWWYAGAMLLLVLDYFGVAGIGESEWRLLAVVVVALQLLLPLASLSLNAALPGAAYGWHSWVSTLFAALQGEARLVAVGLAVLLAMLFEMRAGSILVPSLMVVWLMMAIPGEVAYSSLLEARFDVVQTSSAKNYSQWRKYVEPGSLVLTDGAVPVSVVWFELHASSYFSYMQGPGMLFSRKLALEYRRRQQAVSTALQQPLAEELARWCQEQGISYIITRRQLLLKKLDEIKGVGLYAVDSNPLPVPAKGVDHSTEDPGTNQIKGG